VVAGEDRRHRAGADSLPDAVFAAEELGARRGHVERRSFPKGPRDVKRPVLRPGPDAVP